MANAHYELTTPLGSRVRLPEEVDKPAFYHALSLYLANPSQTKPLIVHVNDPSVSYFVHHAAMTAGLLPTPATPDAFDSNSTSLTLLQLDPKTEIFNLTVPSKISLNNMNPYTTSTSSSASLSDDVAPIHLTYPRFIALHKGHEQELNTLRTKIMEFARAHNRRLMESTAPVHVPTNLTNETTHSVTSGSQTSEQSPPTIPTTAAQPAVPRCDLPPAPAPLRYAARVFARDCGIVGQSEGIGTTRRTVLWADVDKQSIDARLRAFANSEAKETKNGDPEALVFPPMCRLISAITISFYILILLPSSNVISHSYINTDLLTLLHFIMTHLPSVHLYIFPLLIYSWRTPSLYCSCCR